jgi:integrase
MTKHHPKNERMKRKYAIWLKDAKQKAIASIDPALAAIALFEASTRHKDFASFHIEQARAFKAGQLEAINTKTGKPLAKATAKSRLDAVKTFFLWLADQPGYRARIRYADCEYFNVSAHDARIAGATRERPAPELAQVHQVIDAMPSDTPAQKRDRAVIAFTLLTGARDDAVASLSLRHVDLVARMVKQDARDVRTKNRKTFDTWFFPVGGQAEAVVTGWINYLVSECNYGPDDPLFPQTALGLDGSGYFAATGLKRDHWKNADAIRRAFKTGFVAAGMPYFHPHSIRKTLVRLGEQICQTPEQFKAWSQNLGHEKVMTTFTNYGTVAPERQAEIIAKLGNRGAAKGNDIDLAAIAAIEATIAELKGRLIAS